jgi:hypothetical protein
MRWSHALPATVVTAAALLGAAPADSPGARLALTLHHGLRTDVAPLAAVELDCDPDAGTHPRPTTACTALRAADGDFGAVRPQDGVMCPMIYDPVTAEATGLWAGRLVRYTHTFANRCAAETESGGVFAF